MTPPPLWIERNGDVAPLSFEEAEAMAATELEHVRISTVFLSEGCR